MLYKNIGLSHEQIKIGLFLLSFPNIMISLDYRSVLQCSAATTQTGYLDLHISLDKKHLHKKEILIGAQILTYPKWMNGLTQIVFLD